MFPDAVEVTDLNDPRLDDYRDLRDRELRVRRTGDPGAFGGLFIGEQRLVVERMLALPGVTRSVLAAPRHAGRLRALAPPEVPVYAAPLAILKQVAGFNIHRGVLAAGRRDAVERVRLDLVAAPAPLTLLACEGVRNMDNVGLLFRNAAAFAAGGVLLSPSCHDPLYRKSLRVSIGHALTVPFARSRNWHDDLRRLRDRHGMTLIAAATGGGAAPAATIPPARRVAIVVGGEYDGLAGETIRLCDHVARIPMAPGVDSLNVAVAAAVLLDRHSTGRRA